MSEIFNQKQCITVTCWHNTSIFNSFQLNYISCSTSCDADDPTQKWRVRPHQVSDWGEGLRGGGFLRRSGWLRGKWHTGDSDQPVHILQGFPVPPHVWQRPDAHTVWECHLSSLASGVHFGYKMFSCSKDSTVSCFSNSVHYNSLVHTQSNNSWCNVTAMYIFYSPAPAWHLHPAFSFFSGPSSHWLQFSWHPLPHQHRLCSAQQGRFSFCHMAVHISTFQILSYLSLRFIVLYILYHI